MSLNFQEFTLHLSKYWMDLGCLWSQPYDLMMGAGTFHPHTFLRGIGPEPWRSVYVQPCRRPVDGRYGKSSYRFQHYYQLQVLLKPSPANIIDLFLQSLVHVGISLSNNDVSLLEDDWKGPTLGAWGLGWEVRANGQEVTQFTYFQQLGGLDIDVVPGEITYGLERLYMYATGIKNGMDIPFNDRFSYADVFLQNEFEFSFFNFKEANVQQLLREFEECEQNVSALVEKRLVLPAYDFVLRASHAFNLLDARGAISATERQRYIGRVRDCAKKCAQLYRAEREKLGFPLSKAFSADPRESLTSLTGSSGALGNISSPGISLHKPFQGDESEITWDSSRFDIAKNGSFVSAILELGVEEMPPSFQTSSLQALEKNWLEFLEKKRLEFSFDEDFVAALALLKASFFVTSRRIALKVERMPLKEPDSALEIWGPAERIARDISGNFTAAGLGFLRKNKIDSGDIKFKERSDGVFLYATKGVAGGDFPNLVAQWFKQAVECLEAPLVMRWLPSDLCKPFIRPVRWLLGLVEGFVIDLDMFGIKAARNTFAPRCKASKCLKLESAKDYGPLMQEQGVELDWNQRKQFIVRRASELAYKVEGKLRYDEALANKCAGLTETPFVFLGSFDSSYLSLPADLIVSVLREHMNYFAVENAAGELLPYYLGVAGHQCDDLDQMIAGTKDVVTGRLDDGAFYFKGDLETPILDLKEKLKGQLFQNEMGSLFEKCERVALLAEEFAKSALISGLSSPRLVSLAKLAGEFCKADLRTGCVQEFPDEMQGIMGGILVDHQKPFGTDSHDISIAIAEHYAPNSASAPLPSSVLGKIVSLADKLDSLCLMIFKGGEIRGNKDPLGLRRLAIGVLRLLGLEGEESIFDLSITELIEKSYGVLSQSGFAESNVASQRAVEFFVARIKAAWKSQFDSGAVEAALWKMSNYSLPTLYKITSALDAALSRTGNGSFRQSLVPFRRSRNITQTEMERGCLSACDLSLLLVNSGLFRSVSENQLFAAVIAAEREADGLIESGNFSAYFELLEGLGSPLSTFFEEVMVLDEDPEIKLNRLSLLCRLRGLYEKVADFSLVQVD